VRRLISQMPMSQRMTLSLVDVARLSYRETAAVMNIGLLDVQYHVVTARRQLLEEMQLGNEQYARPARAETAESF
jgi:DNA-directed RNA polymerase specialized sigma24 family protein